MIFKQWQQVLDGTKIQTRRIVKPGEVLITDSILFRNRVLSGSGYCKWMVGKTYAVQPGRGKRAVGRIRITRIRRERLQDIDNHDSWGELGMVGSWQWPEPFQPGIFEARDVFAELWNSINKKPGTQWEDNPEVWPLTFELVL